MGALRGLIVGLGFTGLHVAMWVGLESAESDVGLVKRESLE